MISSLKDKNGLIYAYIEWQVVDEKGQFQDYGNFVYIQDVWIHEKFQRRKVLGELIRMAYDHKFTKFSEYVYWVRHKYKERKSIYLKERFKIGENYGRQKEIISTSTC